MTFPNFPKFGRIFLISQPKLSEDLFFLGLTPNFPNIGGELSYYPVGSSGFDRILLDRAELTDTYLTGKDLTE